MKKKTNTKYYFIFVWHDVDPEMHGPYKTAERRYKACLKCVEENGLDGNSYFWLDNQNGKLKIGTYSSDDLDAECEQEDCCTGER